MRSNAFFRPAIKSPAGYGQADPLQGFRPALLVRYTAKVPSQCPPS
jgi:hypothetical protein